MLYRGKKEVVPVPKAVVTKHVIQQHQNLVLGGDDQEDHQRMSVRRSHVLKDAVKAFSKLTFVASKVLKVVFIGEQSVNDGGPRREMFEIVMREMFTQSGLFTGWPCHVVPIHNIQSVANNDFYVIGKIISTSIVQGGQPPVCFAPPVADFLAYNKVKCNPSIKANL